MIGAPEEIVLDPVRERLLKAALDSFLADDYHKVTTRLIAEKADANVSMIRYYFGNKEGLYEEMIRETLNPLLKVLDGQLLDTVDGQCGSLGRRQFCHRLRLGTIRSHHRCRRIEGQ
jgi:AcrR family transcriptional regulator